MPKNQGLSGSPGKAPKFGFIGTPGTGKTTAAIHLARAHPRVMMVDPSGLVPSDYRAYHVENAIAVGEEQRVYWCTWSCAHLRQSEMRAGVDRLVDWATHRPEFVVVVVDEWGQLAVRGKQPSEPIQRALRGGRHNRTSVWPVGHRVTDFDPDVRMAIDVWYFFRQTENLDIDRLRKIGGEDFAETIRALPDRWFVRRETKTGRWQLCRPLEIAG
jgi:hypothetical protein